ncbi:MAG: MarC family protein [Thermodesulfobacteriota bacterium]
MKAFWLAFVPLFVAVDALGVLPLYLGLTEDLDQAARRRIISQSVATATVVALTFLVAGTWILRLLGLTIADFMIAGGCVLFALSLRDLLTADKALRQVDPDSLGAVPIGVPLITGPAVLTTSLLVMHQHGFVIAALAVVTNILIAGITFLFAGAIHRVLGRAGSKTLSKIASLLLAAIAVMMVRRGLVALVTGSGSP